ncbi:MAG: PH domain-containing protein [Planctomycetota bacterium]|nr:PH domain-containing protein [Planctomycetota bacterium]
MKLEQIKAIDRPSPKQLTLYFINCALGAVFTLGIALAPIVIGMVPLFIRYYTMRYRFDESGVGVSYGYFFRHESYLTYDKIQDIHLNRGFIERWLGLGTVEVQTAAGSSGAEVTFIGLTQFDEVRDFLYARMRQGKGTKRPKVDPSGEGEAGLQSDSDSEALALLRSIRDEVSELKAAVLAQQDPAGGHAS